MHTINTPFFYEYQVGGSLPVKAPSYIERQSDEELYRALLKGEFCYVLNARQMGKSSLRVQMMHRLQAVGIRASVIDMSTIGTQQITSEQWYASILQTMVSIFRLKLNLRSWWREQAHLSPVKRFEVFLETVLLIEVEQDIVLFIDEIDSVLGLDFSIDDFFALIRACYNRRAEEPIYRRLTFTLLGVTTPSDLIADKTRTPFNIGNAIELQGFQLPEALPLLMGLQEIIRCPESILHHILSWTDGQPFLTQKLCQLVLDACSAAVNQVTLPSGQEGLWVENLVQSRIIDSWELRDKPEHLRTIAHRLLNNEQQAGNLLGFYQQVLLSTLELRRQQEQNPENLITLSHYPPIAVDASREQIELLLSGLVVKEQGHLRVRNRIYEQVFNLKWIKQQLANLRPYGSNLAAWLNSGRADESYLLQGQALQKAQNWAKGKRLSEEDFEFLAASAALEQQKQQEMLEAKRTAARLVQERKIMRLQRVVLVVISLALIVSLALGFVALQQNRQAKMSETEAIARSSEALYESNSRLDALVEAIRARQRLLALGTVDAGLNAQVEKVLRRSVYGAIEKNRLSGHQDFVYSVAYSPDGQTIATASADKTIKLWNANGKLLTTLQGHQGWVSDVVFSPDGKTIASCSQDRTIKLWQRNGRLIRTIQDNSAAFDIAFSSDGQTLAAANADGTVKLWRPDGRLIQTLAGHQGLVWGVAFSPDDETIASAGADKTIKLWQHDGHLIRTLEGHQDQVYTVAFSPDGKQIASGSDDNTIKLWTIEGRLLQTLKGHDEEIWGVAFSPDGGMIASASADKTIKIWQRDGTLKTTLNQGEGAWRVAFSPNGTQIASSGSNKIVKIWQLQHPLLTRLSGHRDWVLQVAFSADGQQLASASWDSTVKRWARDGRLLTTFKGQNSPVNNVTFSPDGRKLASGSQDNIVKLWQPDGTVLKTFSLLQSAANGIQTTGNAEPRAETGGVVFSPDGQMLIAGSDTEMIVKRWRSDGTPLPDLICNNGGVAGLRFSPDGQTIAVAGTDGTIQLWNRNGTLIQTMRGHSAKVQDVAFSPDARFLASASHDGTVKLWTLNGKLIRTFLGHRDKVYGVAFSVDGRMIATASRDKTIKLWQLDGTLLATLTTHEDAVFGIAFSPDGQFMASSSLDKTVILWHLHGIVDLRQIHQTGCEWVRDYLYTNAAINEHDRHLCDS